jgi:hypothetical protein
VRTRRALQTRAYHAWILAGCLRRGWVASARAFDAAPLSEALEFYLVGLQRQLEALGSGESVEAIDGAVRELDDCYEKLVRTLLKEAMAYMRYRYYIFPYFSPTGGLVGFWDERTQYTVGEAEAVARFVFERCPWSPEIVQALAHFLRTLDTGDSEESRRSFNAFLQMPRVIEAWSVPLAALSPGEGEYREIAFEYH